MSSTVDPVTVSVIQHRLYAIVAEMGEAMLRTSYSQILNSSRDFSTAICDSRTRLVAQAEHVPIHVGAVPFAVRSVQEFFKGEIRPGDVYLLNDPYHGGNHLPDLTAFVPVFAGTEHLFWTIVRAHQSDIGGATHGAYNPAATEIWQEGLRVTPLRLYDRGELRRDVFDMLAINVRHPRDFKGDLMASIGAARNGERRLAQLVKELGGAVVGAAVDAILDGAERQARAVVATWKDGVYKGEAFLDDDGQGRTDVAIRAKITKRGSDLEVDLTGSDPQCTGFVNSSHANMMSAVAMAFAFLIDPQTPRNEGTFRPLKVKAKPGTVVWCENNAPLTLCTSHCSNEIVEAMVRAIAPACPDRAMGGWGRRFRIAMKGKDPRTGKGFIWHLFHARPGGGGTPFGDGWHSAGEWHSVGGLKFSSVEVAEVRFPLHFRRHEFRPDSAGDGQWRGGVGVDLDLVVEAEGETLGNTAGDGVRYGSAGILGGQDSLPHRYVLHSKGRKPRVLKTKEVGIVIRPGDVLEVHSAGGGGWGDPRKRSAAARESDAENGLVTRRKPVSRAGAASLRKGKPARKPARPSVRKAAAKPARRLAAKSRSKR
ncbi:MAG: hydantoinase B/oxoprolinase family protein [Alphaproteobacteria bacterium]|nr:hydantoinase B/oxoprolinase family protein [Alphaproteobacteria bacterium]